LQGVPGSAGDISRSRRLAELVRDARKAFDAGDYLGTLEACERGMRLDPQATDAIALARRARTKLDDEQIARQLATTVEILDRGDSSEADLGAASTFIDRALTVRPGHPAALDARRKLLEVLDRRAVSGQRRSVSGERNR
jgi:hypothetical protein